MWPPSPSVSPGCSTVIEPPSSLLACYVGLGAALRDAGVTVGTGQQVSFARALTRVDPADRDDVYWAGRCCLLTRAADIATYDAVFTAWFGGGPGGALSLSGPPPTGRGAATAAAARTDLVPVAVADRHGEVGLVAAAHERLRHKDFAACTDDERAEIARLLAQLSLVTPQRRSRRSHTAPDGRRPDLRRALRDMAAEEARRGELRWRRPRRQRRPLMLVLDVSGSMSAYSRLLLQFAWSTRHATDRVEVFCFGTRLTRVTGELAHRDPDAALAHAAATVVDWDGGTRIGESLRELLRVHSRRAGCRGAVVVVCSDGLERGDPDLLGAQLARLRRLSHRIVWVNPLSADRRFEPVTRGMTAALPHLDALVAGHSVASLEALSRVVSELV